MRIRRIRPAVLEVTLHAYELSALVAAARWAAEGGRGEMAPEALDQIEQVLANYEASLKRQSASDDGHG
jgi:hypothetical protein